MRQFTKSKNGFFHHCIKKTAQFKRVHVDHTCFEKNFYNIKNDAILKDYLLEDSRYIENKGFGYENTLNQFLDVFRSRQAYLVRREFVHLVETYLSMKHRTKVFRKNASEPKLLGTSIDSALIEVRKHFIEKFLHKYPENILGELYDSLTTDFKSKTLTNPDVPIENHLKSTLEIISGTNDSLNDVVNRILQMNFDVIEIQNESDFFITSDNPGYTRNGLGIFSLNFGAFDSIFFPINSKQVIRFLGTNPLNYVYNLRPINYVKATRIIIDDINYCTYCMADEKVYCEDRSYLQNFIKVVIPSLENFIKNRDLKISRAGTKK